MKKNKETIRLRRTTKKELEKLWKEIIKTRAGFKSELSGAAGKQIGGHAVLVAHHIVGKPTDALRFLELDNGICLENGTEHIYGVHHKFDASRARHYQDLIINKIGLGRYEKLLQMRKLRAKKKTDLEAARIYLAQKLETTKNKTEEQ